MSFIKIMLRYNYVSGKTGLIYAKYTYVRICTMVHISFYVHAI